MPTTDQPAPSGYAMLYVHGVGYINAKSAAVLGMKGEEAYHIEEPAEPATKPKKRPAPKADNDNAVFDNAEAAREMPSIVDEQSDWTPPSTRAKRGTMYFRYGKDGPSITWRKDAQVARLTSNRFSGQAANDNQDWPLAKTLRAEGRYLALMTAERYRDLWNAANLPHDLIGRDIGDDLYVLGDRRLDESTGEFIDKGPKALTGRKAQVDVAPTRAVKADPDKTKKRAKPVPKKWQGDWPLLNHIDADRELAAVQDALGFLRDGFESAVVFGATLEEVGHDHGVGNKTGAKGGGRSIVMLGIRCVDEFWQRRHNRYTAPSVVPLWESGKPVPDGYYRSVIQPDMIFRKAA